MSGRVLIAVGESSLRETALGALRAAGFEVALAPAPAAKAWDLLQQEGPDVVLVGVSPAQEDADGFELLRRLAAHGSEAKVVIVAAGGALEAAVAALPAGAAAAFIDDPAPPGALVAAVATAARVRLLEQRLAYLGFREQARSDAATFIHAAPRMAQMIPHIEAVARSTVPAVLVTGESGTGKAAVARFLHDASPRAAGPFVELASSAIPEDGADSALFGREHDRGVEGRARNRGLVEIADGGTLFVDEVADLAPPAQAKLLLFLERGELRRVGGWTARRADVRVVAATKRDLRALVAVRAFREDLLHRLEGITLALPPLRERPEDIAALSGRFMGEAVREHARPFKTISPEAHALLQSYRWPGNVWELRFVIRRAVLRYHDEVLRVPHLSHVLPDPSLTAGAAAAGPGDGGTARTVIPSLAQIDLAHIRRVLEICGGNRTLAAHHLGITRQTLAKKIGGAEPQ
jgi:two-component system response regulator HydG